MNVLVTGISGFIGFHLANELATQGHRVYGTVNDTPPRDMHPNVTPIQADICDNARMLDIVVNREIDQIFHLAARPIVRNCRLNPIDCFYVNVMGTVSVLEAARQSDRISGVMVMESDKSYGQAVPPYDERQRLEPTGVYEASKACVSHVMTAYSNNYELPVFSIRAANVYGPGDPNETRVIPRTILRLLAGEPAQLTGGGVDYRRGFIFITDFLTYVQRLMKAKPWGEVFNVGSGHTISIRELLHQLCLSVGGSQMQGIGRLKQPATLTEIAGQELNLDKLFTTVKPIPSPVTIEQGIKACVAWYREPGPVRKTNEL